jgi:hypothetical protein
MNYSARADNERLPRDETLWWVTRALLGSLVYLLVAKTTSDLKAGLIAGVSAFVVIDKIGKFRIYIESPGNKGGLINLVLGFLVVIAFGGNLAQIIGYATALMAGTALTVRQIKLMWEGHFLCILTLVLVTSCSLAIGHTINGYPGNLPLGYPYMLVTGIIFGFTYRNIWQSRSDLQRENRSFSKYASNIAFVAILTIFTLLCWRTDTFDWVDGSLYHWAYFTGPASEYRSPAGLASANQYSTIAIYLASLISHNPWRGVYIIQSTLYTLVTAGAAIIGWKKDGNIKLLILAGLFLLLLSDPGSVGPQSFPSSGLMRFFPVYLYIYGILVNINQTSEAIGSSKGLVLKVARYLTLLSALIVGALWSPESLACIIASTVCCLIIVFWRKTTTKNLYSIFNIDAYRYKPQHMLLAFIIAILVLFAGLAAAHLLNTTDVSYALNYTYKRYGWINPSAWLYTLPPFLTCLVVIEYILRSGGRRFCTSAMLLAGSGLILAYVAYRPVSNNVTVTIPVMVAICGAVITVGLNDPLKTDIDFRSRLEISQLIGLSTLVLSLSAFLLAIQQVKLKEVFSGNPIRRQDLLEEDICGRNNANISSINSQLSRFDVHLGKGTGIVPISKDGFIDKLGSCFKDMNGEIYPLVLQPPQLYLEPLDILQAKDKINIVVGKRGIKTLVILYRDDKFELQWRRELLQRIPSSFKNVETDRLSLGNIEYMYDVVKRE